MEASHKIHKARLNKIEKLALWVVSKVGSVWFFVACFILATIPLIVPRTMYVVQYISSGYLQLILLPIIVFGQNLQSRLEDIKSENMYELTKKIDKELINKENL